MKRASIDIGSNSVLLLAGTYAAGNVIEEINESRITSLGKDLDKTKKFHPDSMDLTYKALKEYAELLKSRNFDLSKVLVTATEASRVAENASSFFEKIKNELRLEIKIINADGEAYYTALGVASSLSDISIPSAVIMDIGGASTELIKITLSSKFLIEKSISLPIGSVRATDWIKDNNHEIKWLDLKNKYAIKNYNTDCLICVAGSMTALGAIFFDLPNFESILIEGKKISKNKFIDFLNNLNLTTESELLSKYQFLGKRVYSIKGGIFVAASFINEVVNKEIMISTRGLRYGTFIAGELDGSYVTN